jgi:hypothetical protein
MTVLTLRSIGSNDFAVMEDGHPVGRIRLAVERHGEIWMWNCTLPIPGVPSGTADSFEDAKTTFRQSWMKCKAQIGPERLAQGLETAEAARKRLKAKGK